MNIFKEIAYLNCGDTGPFNWHPLNKFCGMKDNHGEHEEYDIYGDSVHTSEYVTDILSKKQYQVHIYNGKKLILR